MFELLIVPLVPAVALAGGVLVLRRREAARWHSGLVSYRLRCPYGLKAEAVVRFVAGLSGLVAPRWQRVTAMRIVGFETTATHHGIAHHLVVARWLAPTVLAQLQAALPTVAAAEDPDYRLPPVTAACEFRLVGTHRPLAADVPVGIERLAASVLASLQPLQPGEQLVVQWLASPVGPVTPVRRPVSRRGRWGWLSEGEVVHLRDADALSAARAKRDTPLFVAVGRLGVVASRSRASLLLGRLEAAFHTVDAPGAHLARRLLPPAWAVRRVRRRAVPVLVWPCSVNARELAAVVALPAGGLVLPGLSLGGCRPLAPASAIAAGGRVLARSNFAGMNSRPLGLSVADSLTHLYVSGPSGVGKSTLLLNLATADIARGDGVVVIDPKDLADDLLDRLPAERVAAGDVVVFDPGDTDYPVGLNLLAGAADNPELVVDQVVGVFHRLFKAFWGPRTDDVLRAALRTLVRQPGMTLCEVPLLLTDPGFRRRLVGHIDDPIALGPFWAWYDSLSDGQRAEVVGPIMNKLRSVLGRRAIRNVVGQADARFDLEEAIAHRRIIVASLKPGVLGEDAAALIGSLLVARLWQVIQKRAARPASQRHPVFVYLDEFQHYVNLPTDMGDMLAEARALGAALTLANQHLGQLPAHLQQGVLANARSRATFQAPAADARVLARDLAPYLGAADLQGLGWREVVLRLVASGQVQPPATGVTLPPPPSTGQAQAARQASRQRYGRPRMEVEAAIRRRHDGGAGFGAVGRSRRQP